MLKKEKAGFYVLFKTSEGSCTHEGNDLIMSQAAFPAKRRRTAEDQAGDSHSSLLLLHNSELKR